MHLLDISHPMLNAAYRHANDSLGQSENVFIVQIQANFHHLVADQQFFYTPAFDKRRRVFIMLGATFANIDNEVRFARHSLGRATKGDMLLVDIDQVRGSTEVEIRQNDPRLIKAPADLDKWLGGLVKRHCEDCLLWRKLAADVGFAAVSENVARSLLALLVGISCSVM